ncbi:hypothetical protein BH24ACT5_BH24ACT5_22530 [soil metagenome]
MTSPVTSTEEPTDATDAPQPDVDTVTEIEDELLIEEISIDGMCGVY